MKGALLFSKNGPLAGLVRSMVPARWLPIGYLTWLVQQRTGLRVRQGPFAGMRYTLNSVGSAYLPKLLGIYERELAVVVEEICARQSPLIIDIGAAEGYYAVGFALRNPNASIMAFEMEPCGREALRALAHLNGVASRIEVRGLCEPAGLSAALAPGANAVLVCDVEGCEDALLEPGAVPGLARAAILVELHEFVQPGITETIRARFEPTHKIQLIWQQARSELEFPWRTLTTWLLGDSYLRWAVSEWRPTRMCWLWMQPKNDAGPVEQSFSTTKRAA